SSKNTQTDERYVSVQDYTGEGYRMKGGEEEEVIAKKNREEIEKAVKEFFLDKYKTEVEVQHMIGADGAATVFVKSKGLLDFHTYAIVPINDKENKVFYNKVRSQPGDVERAMQTALYQISNKEAFDQLQKLTANFPKKYPIVGENPEFTQKFAYTGYVTPFFYIGIRNHALKPLLEEYLKNPNISEDEIKKAYTSNKFKTEDVIFSLQYFMKEKKSKPDSEIFEQLSEEIKKADNLPSGSYGISLHDNYVNKFTGLGSKKGSLDTNFNHLIIKQ
uniref:DUF1672 family protein n=1 Tax=Bacillus mediterraneensis TaxID=1805474 RepID=UPI00114D4491